MMPDPGSPWERENPNDGLGYIPQTTDPSSDVVERLRANIHRSPFGWTWKPNAMPSAADVADVLATIERLSAEQMQLREGLQIIARTTPEIETAELCRKIARAALSNTAEKANV